MRLIWLPRAGRNRRALINYIAQRDGQAALRLLREVRRQSQSLLEFPERGRIGRQGSTRELVVVGTPYVLVYRVRPRAQRIEILAMLHERQ